MTTTEISLIKEAREIVRTQPMSEKVAYLRDLTDELAEHYDLVKVKLTRTSLQNLIGSATRTLFAINAIVGAAPTPPQEGAGSGVDIEKIAA